MLGWGGYWAWDPVENIALLPWLASTAFLHSVMVQERRGMLKVWNLSLIVGAFGLTMFGTFLTRGSILPRVHAFAECAVGPLYLGFLLLVLAGGFGLIAARSKHLAREGRFDAVLSREAAFLGNNLLLLALTLIVLVGTIFPLFVEALTGSKVSVGGPYFDRTAAPVLILLLFLMGIGPLLPWRRATGEQVRRRAAVPRLGAPVTIVGLALDGRAASRRPSSRSGWRRSSRVERRLIAGGSAAFGRAAGARGPGPSGGAVGRNRRLTAGWSRTSAWRPGDRRHHVGDVRAADGGHAGQGSRPRSPARAALRGAGSGTSPSGRAGRDVTVTRAGGRPARLHPSLNFYPASTDPIGTPSIQYGLLKDLYASVLGFQAGTRRATFRFFLNPGVMGVWVGAGVMAFGGTLAGWPGRRRRRKASGEPVTSDPVPSPLKEQEPEPAPAS